MSATAAPPADLAAIRKSITDLRQQEKAAIRALPSAAWQRDYDLRRSRTLRSSKTVEVDVDYEIDKDDLEDLGYHHEDDCNSVPGGVLEAASQSMSDWHDRTHGFTLWSACAQEPCNVLPVEYRTRDYAPVC